MIGIYKITNKINNKSYIGQSQDIKMRLLQHQKDFNKTSSSQYNGLLYKAIRKYGINNFDFSILEECALSELDEKEIYWIDFYRTFVGWDDCQGYNMTIGGHGARQFSIQEIQELWNQQFSQNQICEILNASTSTVHHYLIALNITEEEIKERACYDNSKRILQYSLTGQLLNSFKSISDAVREIQTEYPNACTSNICLACKHQLTTAYRYFWKYEDDSISIDTLIQKAQTVTHHGTHKVNQYTIDGDFIQTFSSIKEAALAVNLKSTSAICNVCAGIAQTAGGFRWKYTDSWEDNNNLPKLNSTNKKLRGQKIAQYDLNNNLISIFNNRQEAAQAVNGLPQGISNVCCHSKKTYKGFIWKYLN